MSFFKKKPKEKFDRMKFARELAERENSADQHKEEKPKTHVETTGLTPKPRQQIKEVKKKPLTSDQKKILFLFCGVLLCLALLNSPFFASDDSTETEIETQKETVTVKEPEPTTEESENVAESEVKDNSNSEGDNEEILTKDNNKELAEILSTKDETSPLFKAFAQKYTGRTIEFDGNTFYVGPYKDYKTRFNYFIFVGDYSTTTFSGPEFQLRNVDYYDLHLTGDNVPVSFGAGLNIRITATIEGYNEDPFFILLDPVSIKVR